MKYFTLLSICFSLLLGCKSKTEPAEAPTQERFPDLVVAFGSCNMPEENNPFWDDILAENPDVWIWGGDIVYADTDDMDRLRNIYAKQDSVQGYAELKANIPIIGTWDDHDFGLNDGGAGFKVKKKASRCFWILWGFLPTVTEGIGKGSMPPIPWKHPRVR